MASYGLVVVYRTFATILYPENGSKNTKKDNLSDYTESYPRG
jgi:hypothetical protein